jgi:hypothetical protein
MKHFLVFLVFMTLSNFSFAGATSAGYKTTGETLREQKITDDDICKMACESKFQSCYNNQIKNGFKCAAEVVTCKNRCKKESEKK